MHTITFIAGDRIGSDVTRTAREIALAASAPVAFEDVPAAHRAERPRLYGNIGG